MKKFLAALLTAVSIMVSAAFAYAETAPVALTHTLTGYSKGAKTVTLEYAVQVLNQQDVSLAPLTLTLVPRPPFVMTKSTFSVELGPKGTADLKVKVETPLLREQAYFSQKPLLWAARFTDADGKLVEFPIKSRAGGDK